MRLAEGEFQAMNTAVRRFFQRRLEFPVFQRLGLTEKKRDILEIGCGSGYGAVLLARLEPRSYVGIDIMPEMIELARQRPGLAEAQFLVQDATDLTRFAESSKDIVVIFGILHHIPGWRTVIEECHRVLRPGGKMFLEEPMGSFIAIWDVALRWSHPKEARFSRRELEEHIKAAGLTIMHRIGALGLGSYCVWKETAPR